MINFYQQFIPNAMKELDSMKCWKVLKQRERHYLGTKVSKSIQCKDNLSVAAILAHPDSKAEITLTTDASDVATDIVI